MSRVVFFGSPACAAPVLRAVVDAGHDVVAVYTQPDRVAGRSREPLPTAVKQVALEQGLSVRTPRSLRREAARAELAALGAEAFIVAAYGRLLPAAVLAIPPLGALNLHPSLLPRHRGPSPVTTAILEGDPATGVTIMLLDEGMDTGPILAQSDPVAIRPSDTGASLTTRLFEIGAALMVDTLERVARGQARPRPQDHSKATLTRLLKRADGEIDWSQPAAYLERKVRAFDPWPGTFTWMEGKRLKVLRASVDAAASARPGEVAAGPDGARLRVGTGAGMLVIERLQLEGRNAVSAAQFLRGYPRLAGSVLPS